MNGAVSTLNKARHSPISFNSPSMFNSPNLHPPNLPRASFIINSKPSNGPKTLGNTTIPEVLNLVSLPCKPSFSHHFPIIFPWKQPHFLLLSDTPGAPAPYCKGSGGNGKPWLIAKAAKAWRYWLSSKKIAFSEKKMGNAIFMGSEWDLNGIFMGSEWDLNAIFMGSEWDLNGIFFLDDGYVFSVFRPVFWGFHEGKLDDWDLNGEINEILNKLNVIFECVWKWLVYMKNPQVMVIWLSKGKYFDRPIITFFQTELFFWTISRGSKQAKKLDADLFPETHGNINQKV